MIGSDEAHGRPNKSKNRKVRVKGTESHRKNHKLLLRFQWAVYYENQETKGAHDHPRKMVTSRGICNRIAGVRGGQIDAVSIPEGVDGIEMPIEQHKYGWWFQFT